MTACRKSKLAIFKDQDSSSSETDSDENQATPGQVYIPTRDPTETIFEMGVNNMNDFLTKIQKFESITQDRMKDLWRIKDVAFVPLEVRVDVQEYIAGLFDILKPDQTIPLIKVLSTFCYLEIESTNLKNEVEQNFFDPLIYFGESGSLYEDDRPEEEKAGNMEIEMSRMLPIFSSLLDTVRKLTAITKNILYQMNGLFNSKYPVYKDHFQKLTYTSIFDNLGSMLINLYIIDLIINENTAFQDYWQQYNIMFDKVKSNLEMYNMTSKMLKKIMRQSSKLYTAVINGQLYLDYLEGLREAIRAEYGDNLFKNETFQKAYKAYLDLKIVKVEQLLTVSGAINSQTEYMQLLINYSIYRKLFGKEDKDMHKKIWSLQKNCPVLVIYNNLYAIPGNFLAQICPLKTKITLEPADIRMFLRAQLQGKEGSLPSTVQQYHNRLVLWITQMNSDALKDSDAMLRDRKFLEQRAVLISNGITLATEIKRNMKSFLLLVQQNETSLRKEMFPYILKSIEMLKAIEIEFKSKKFLINKWVVLINRNTSEQIIKIIEIGMQTLNAYKKKDIIYMTLQKLVTTILDCISGGYNALRKTIVAHCLSLLQQGVFKPEQYDSIQVLMQRLSLVCNWEVHARRATRCRFIYWHRVLNEVFLQFIVNDRFRLNQMNYYVMAMQDPIDMLQNIRHLGSPQLAIDNYKKDIFDTFSKYVIHPICSKTEEELRAQIHQVLIPNMKQTNPLQHNMLNIQAWAQMNDIYLFEKKISIKAEIRDYLSQIFYEMNAYWPHDYRTYEHIRVLCEDKLNIPVLRSHFPP